MGDIHVGTCGYGHYEAPDGWKDDYETKLQAFTHDFQLLEVNRTFYELPRTATCEKWRGRAAEGFTFTLKAWQALTHPISSPTWRGRAKGLSDAQREQFGYLRPHETVIEAWKQTLERTRALEAPVVLVQCPASFEPSDEHEKNLRELMSTIDRGGAEVAWEPRGDWLRQPERVATLCEDLRLVHVVDPMRRDPAYLDGIAYLRLHGLNEDPYDYNYDYTNEELGTLADRLEALNARCDDVYCLFNNFEKFANARTLESLLEAS